MSSPKRVPMDPPGETSAGRLRQEQSRTHARHHSLQSHHAQTIHTNGNGGRTRHHSLKPYSTQTYATNGSGTESNNPVLPLDRRTQLQSSHSTPQFHHQQLQSQMSSSTFATPAIQQSHSMPVSPTSHRSSYTGPMPTTPTTIHDSAGRSDTDSPSNNHRASSNSSSSSSSPFPFSPHNSQQAFRDREGPSRATEADKSSSLHHHHQQNVDLTKPPTEPGAYRVVKHRPSGTKAYRLVIPPGIGPGQDFVYEINSRRVEVTCPDTAHSGSELEIAVPHAAEYKFYPLKVAQLTASPSMTTTTNTNSSAAMALSGDRRPQGVEGGAYAMIPEIKFINQQALEAGGTVRTHVVTIPDHAVPGATFSVEIGGSRFKVVCPDGTPPGSRIRIVPPPDVPEPEPSFQPFAVQVPEGVKPGGQFAVLVGTQQVLVECPHSAVSGKIVRIKLPTQTVTGNIKMSYPSGSGWIRTIRASDMKFQWVRLHEAIVAVDDTFNFTKSAYVRKLTELEGNDPRLRTASIELVSAEHAVVDSRFKTGSGKLLFSYADIAFQQGKPLAEKHEWFLSMCQQLTDSVSAFENGAACVKIILRREQLVHDSIKAVLSLGSDDLRRNWEFQFVNEPGVDRGGLTKEWFECVTEKLFHPDFALFVSSVNNQAAVDINPSVAVLSPDDYLQCYRVAGRIIGKALFSGHLVKGHLVRLLYKYLLGWPTTHDDVKDLDECLYAGLSQLTKMEDVSLASLDFTATLECFGMRVEHELIENGASIMVCNDNVDKYLEKNIRYRTFDRILPQLTELLLGFYDVVPEPYLSVFDASELELILCGLPDIDLTDWQAHTQYTGLFELEGSNAEAVRWFWEVLEVDYDIEMKARLLQFATGTSGVNVEGFAGLQGNDGGIRKFTIHGVDPKTCFYPKAHTCFNQLDLPNYARKEELIERLTVSITTSYVGFDTQ